MDLSVVFSTYKSEEILEKSLQAYCNISTGYKWELIIIDNANRAETRSIIKRYKDKLPINFIEKSQPGKNNALNLALPLVKGSLIFFTDNDVIFEPNVIDVVVESAVKYPDYDVFTGKILPDITLPDWVDFQSHRIRSAFVFSDQGNEDCDVFLEDVWGPNMVVRASLFRNGLSFNGDVGPNGKSYIMGSETELLKRLERQGCKGRYLSQNIVLHQIRKEQLCIDWLKNRAYRSGRGSAFNSYDNSITLFGYPRYLLRSLIAAFIAQKLAIFIGSKTKKCLTEMEYNFILGKLSQASKKNT
jgi:glycosyltransferase involved in cell wall biosynthesis